MARRTTRSDRLERYRWLNTVFIVGEGEIDEKVEELWVDTFVCVNELA